MKRITVLDWKVGFQKVEFTMLLKHELGYSLSAAKAATDRVLDNQCLEIDIPEAKCESMLARVSHLGVRAVVKEEDLQRGKLSEELDLSKR